jgi:hypothetical protein
MLQVPQPAQGKAAAAVVAAVEWQETLLHSLCQQQCLAEGLQQPQQQLLVVDPDSCRCAASWPQMHGWQLV